MKLFGNYRASVVDDKDPEQFGRVKVWIPDIMPLVDPTGGIWARAANNPLGGRNEESTGSDHLFQGTSYIPPKGSWVWIFFEGGNINKPYYWGSLELENTKVLPENQLGEEYQKKWTIIKSSKGRAVVVSDDTEDARVELTGKKRSIKEPPTGDTDSVYKIDGNQTVILLDERDGKEKVLIRTHKGDFFHVDIDEQKLQASFKNGITLKTDGNFYLKAKKFNVKSEGSVNIESTDGMNLKSGAVLNAESGAAMNLVSGALTNIKASAIVGIDGSATSIQSGAASGASPAEPADTEDPTGERDT